MLMASSFHVPLTSLTMKPGADSATQGNWQAGKHVEIPDISFEHIETRLEGNGKVRSLKFIRSMLSWLPEGRNTAKELLEDS